MARRRSGLIDRLEESGAEYVWYISNLPEEDVHRMVGENEWTIHQIAAHMRDTEQHVFLERIDKLVHEEHPKVENFDQDAWNRDHYRWGESLKDILSDFRSARRKVCRLLRGATRKDWENWATHPEYGKISLDWLLEHDYGHTLEHTAQISHMQEQAVLHKLNG